MKKSLLSLLLLSLCWAGANAQRGAMITSAVKISNDSGGLGTALGNGGHFGSAVVSLGDLNNDGIAELAVGAGNDAEGGANTGKVYILYMQGNGNVSSFKTISAPAGSQFGSSLARLDDMDGDGMPELAVGMAGQDGLRGGIGIVFLNNDGTSKKMQKIESGSGNFVSLRSGDKFGSSMANIGDLDQDGVTDLAVSAPGESDSNKVDAGGLYIMFLNANGTLKSYKRISSMTDSFGSQLHTGDNFGGGIAAIGDLDGDSIPELAVGAPYDDASGDNRGAVYILFMKKDGSIRKSHKISGQSDIFSGAFNNESWFGYSIAGMQYYRMYGRPTIAISAQGDNGMGMSRGAVYIVSLNPTGEPYSWMKLSDTTSSMDISLMNNDQFGASLADYTLPGAGENLRLIISAPNDDEGNTDAGAIYVVTFQDTVSGSTGIHPNTLPATQLEVYPNPAQGLMQLHIKGEYPQATLSLLGVDGKVHHTQTLNKGMVSTALTLDLEAMGLKAGVYLLRLQTPGAISSLRIVKQ